MMVFSEYLPMRYHLATMESHASFISRGRLSIVAIIIAADSENTCAGGFCRLTAMLICHLASRRHRHASDYDMLIIIKFRTHSE